MRYTNKGRVLGTVCNIACALTLFTLALFSLNLPATATVTVTPTTSAAALAAELARASGDITIVGTPSLSVGNSTISSGTFTTTHSDLELNRGVVLSTGNVSYIPVGEGVANNIGSGISNPANNEFDITTFSFSFVPKPNVRYVGFAFVFMSDEYGDNSSTTPNNDNFSIQYLGGSPLTVDIRRYNKIMNPQTFRDNTVDPKPLPDIRAKGGTILYNYGKTVTPGAVYTIVLRIADVGNNAGDSSVFFGFTPRVKLALSNSASGPNYSTTWKGGTPVPIAAPDALITGTGENLSSASIAIDAPAPSDLLSIIGTLPAGITASAYDPTTGVITLSGKASYAAYQTALARVGYSSTATTPVGDAKLVIVTINDTNTAKGGASCTIDLAVLWITQTYTLSAPGSSAVKLGDVITYFYLVTNIGTVPMSSVRVLDMHGAPPVQVPLGAGGVTDETLTTSGPAGAAASTDAHSKDGIWDVLAPGASTTFTWLHTVTQAEVDHG